MSKWTVKSQNFQDVKATILSFLNFKSWFVKFICPLKFHWGSNAFWFLYKNWRGPNNFWLVDKFGNCLGLVFAILENDIWNRFIEFYFIFIFRWKHDRSMSIFDHYSSLFQLAWLNFCTVDSWKILRHQKKWRHWSIYLKENPFILWR